MLARLFLLAGLILPSLASAAKIDLSVLDSPGLAEVPQADFGLQLEDSESSSDILNTVFADWRGKLLALAGAAAILTVIGGGALLVLGQVEKGKKAVTAGLSGLLLVVASGSVFFTYTKFLSEVSGSVVADPTLQTTLAETLPKMVLGVIGTVAVIMLIGAGLMMASPVEATHEKGVKLIGPVLGGLVVISLAYAAVRMVADLDLFGGIESSNRDLLSTAEGQPLVRLITLLLSVGAPLASLSFVVGGIMFVVSTGDDGLYRRGLKLMWYAGGGLVVMILAYALVKAVAGLSF